MEAPEAAIILAILLVGAAGFWYMGNHNSNPSGNSNPNGNSTLPNSSTVPDGTSMEVPVTAFDEGSGGNPVGGVEFTASVGSSVAGSVFTAGPSVVSVNITLIAGQSYTFRVNAYGASYDWNVQMLNVVGTDICIYVNSVARTITDVFFTEPY